MVDSWNNIAFVSIQVKGGTYYQFAARTREIDINEGDRMGHDEPSLSGARIWIDEPQADGTITMKIVPIDLDTTSADGGLFQQYRGGTWDTSDALALDTTVPATLTRDEFRVTILWTNDTAATTANGSVTASTQGLRFYADSCRIVSHAVTFTGKEVVVDVTFKFPVRSVANVWNYHWQSCTTSELSALGNYS